MKFLDFIKNKIRFWRRHKRSSSPIKKFFTSAIYFVKTGVKNIGKRINRSFSVFRKWFLSVFFKIVSWVSNFLKASGVKISSGFTATIFFVVNGIKNIGKMIGAVFVFLGRGFVLVVCKIWFVLLVVFVGIKLFFKNSFIALIKGAVLIFSWFVYAIKITAAKISSGFVTTISFVVNGIKNIGKTIGAVFAFLGRGFVLAVCKIWSMLLAVFVGIKLFFKNSFIALIKGAVLIFSWFVYTIKITAAKISSGFVTTISFVVNGIKNIGKTIGAIFAFLGRGFVLAVCKIWSVFLAVFVGIKLFFKNSFIALIKGVVLIFSWFVYAIKITAAKIISGFTATIFFVVNGIKNIGKTVGAFFYAIGRGFVLIVSRIVLGILAGVAFVISFFKAIFIRIYNAVVWCCFGIVNSIKYFLLAVWYGIAAIFSFFNNMLFGTARGIKTGLVYSKAFVASRMKFIGTSLAVVAGIAFLAFSAQWYFTKKNEFLFTSKNIQNDFVEMLDKKLSVTQAELKGYIDEKFEKTNKEIDSVKDIDKKLDTVKELDKKISLNQGEIKEYIDQKFEKKEVDSLKDVSQKPSEKRGVDQGSSPNGEIVSLTDLDQKLSTTQEKIAEYIDQKLKKIDKKIDALKEEKVSYNKNVDGTIKEAVRNQMSSLKEERLKKLIKQQKREKRKKLLRKMLEQDDEL